MMDDIKADAGKVADWIHRAEPKIKAAIGAGPSLAVLVEAAVAEYESADDPATKMVEIVKDIGKALPILGPLFEANAPAPADTVQGGAQ